MSKVCDRHTFSFHVRVVPAGVEGEVELTSEHISVVHVNETINTLVDHIRLMTERNDRSSHLHSGTNFILHTKREMLYSISLTALEKLQIKSTAQPMYLCKIKE